MVILKCKKCGNIIELVNGDNTSISCCEEEMMVMTPNTTDGAKEKHVPYTELKDDMLYVKVGEVEHPMDDNHYIMWIAAVYSDSTVRINLKPGEEPVAYFDYEEGMKIYAYCNLHGLWKGEI